MDEDLEITPSKASKVFHIVVFWVMTPWAHTQVRNVITHKTTLQAFSAMKTSNFILSGVLYTWNFIKFPTTVCEYITPDVMSLRSERGANLSKCLWEVFFFLSGSSGKHYRASGNYL
jgi:hypothetical protein